MDSFNKLFKSVINEINYTDVAHAPGDIIWWWDGGKMNKRVSGGTIEDFHSYLLNDPDSMWRGRASRHRLVIVIPPVKLYAKSVIDIPDDLFNSIMKHFKPKSVMVETPREGLRRVA